MLACVQQITKVDPFREELHGILYWENALEFINIPLLFCVIFCKMASPALFLP